MGVLLLSFFSLPSLVHSTPQFFLLPTPSHENQDWRSTEQPQTSLSASTCRRSHKVPRWPRCRSASTTTDTSPSTSSCTTHYAGRSSAGTEASVQLARRRNLRAERMRLSVLRFGIDRPRLFLRSPEFFDKSDGERESGGKGEEEGGPMGVPSRASRTVALSA